MGLSTGSGVRQWVFQRFANITIIVFTLVLATVLLSDLGYSNLINLFSQTWFKIYLIFTLVVASLNSVLAGWQIVGDYARKFHMPSWLLMGIALIVTLVYFIFALMLIL